MLEVVGSNPTVGTTRLLRPTGRGSGLKNRTGLGSNPRGAIIADPTQGESRSLQHRLPRIAIDRPRRIVDNAHVQKSGAPRDRGDRVWLWTN